MVKIASVKNAAARRIFRKKYEKRMFEGCSASRGEKYENIRFYVIYRSSEWEGLMSYVNNFLWFIDYANRNKMIPVIDMKNHQNTYLEDGELGRTNAYEKFFSQPAKYQMKHVECAKNIVTNKGWASPDSYTKKGTYIVKKKWRNLYRKYINLNNETEKYIQNIYHSIIDKSDIVLGINIRGTDYTRLKIKGLPKQPETSEIIQKARMWFSMYQCTKVFVCCDSNEALEQIKEAFPGGVL